MMTPNKKPIGIKTSDNLAPMVDLLNKGGIIVLMDESEEIIRQHLDRPPMVLDLDDDYYVPVVVLTENKFVKNFAVRLSQFEYIRLH